MSICISLFYLLFSMAIFAFNLVLLLSIAANYTKLHSLTSVLSANLWLVNCISSIFTLFHNLFNNLFQPKSIPLNGQEEDMSVLGPETLNALFNSTVSLLVLMAMAFVQIFSHYQNWLPRSAGVRISACVWVVVVGVVITNFVLVHITQSFAFIVAFQLALISILLVFNLVLHPVNLVLAARMGKEALLTTSITHALWLLMHSLSFTLLAVMLVWESSEGWQEKSHNKTTQLISLQLAAYSVHCMANPMIAVLRDTSLAATIRTMLCNKSLGYSRSSSSQEVEPEAVSWFLPEMSWIIRNIPPPPPYNNNNLCLSQHLPKEKVLCEQVEKYQPVFLRNAVSESEL